MAEISFLLVCSCGEKLKGYFSDLDKIERLHCNCGLVWDIKRPWKDEE